MFVINNKFEIGEECFSVYRRPVDYKCPICDGEGRFMHNGYEIGCKKCNGTGMLHDARQFVMHVCKVRVKLIKATVFDEVVTIKYKVDVVPWEGLNAANVHVHNRGEDSLFKTSEEAYKYCEDANTKVIVPEF